MMKDKPDVLRDIVSDHLPPWTDMKGFTVFLERELVPVPDGECRAVNKPLPLPQLFCKADVGDACENEINAKPQWRRPKLTLREDLLAKAEAEEEAKKEALKLNVAPFPPLYLASENLERLRE